MSRSGIPTFVCWIAPDTSWTICSKCMAVTAGVYGGPRNVLVWCLPVLALSMLFLSVSAISAKALHDSHALPKITGTVSFILKRSNTFMKSIDCTKMRLSSLDDMPDKDSKLNNKIVKSVLRNI